MAENQTGQRALTPSEIAQQAGFAPPAPPAPVSQPMEEMEEGETSMQQEEEPPQANKATGFLAQARFDRITAQRENNPLVFGKLTEAKLVMSDGELLPAEQANDYFFQMWSDNHINLLSPAHNLTADTYKRITLNGVELTDAVLIDDHTRQVVATRGEIVRILRHQPSLPSDEEITLDFPRTVTIPSRLEDDSQPTYAQVMTADGRPIEDPRTYTYRDTFPAALGWQIEWESVGVPPNPIDRINWYAGAVRLATNTYAPIRAYACLISDLDTPDTEDVLKIQLYSQEGMSMKPPYRINGVQVFFQFEIEGQSQGITGLGPQWWTATIDNNEYIDTILGFDHEDEIDRLGRIQVKSITSGKSSRDATILSLRDREAFKHSIR